MFELSVSDRREEEAIEIYKVFQSQDHKSISGFFFVLPILVIFPPSLPWAFLSDWQQKLLVSCEILIHLLWLSA